LVVFEIFCSPRRCVITGRDGRLCDTHQRTAIAAADGVVHDEPVFDSRDEEDQFMLAMDCTCSATPQSSGPPFPANSPPISQDRRG
jgi:hypothetical protein